MAAIDNALDDLISSDADIAEIVKYIHSAFPTYEQAMGAMGDRETDGPRTADSSQLRLRVDPVTTALVK